MLAMTAVPILAETGTTVAQMMKGPEGGQQAPQGQHGNNPADAVAAQKGGDANSAFTSGMKNATADTNSQLAARWT